MWIFLPKLFFTEEKQYNFSWEKYLSKRSLIKHTFSWHDNLLYNVHSTDKRLYIYVYSIQFHESKSALLIWITPSKLHLNKKEQLTKHCSCMENVCQIIKNHSNHVSTKNSRSTSSCVCRKKGNYCLKGNCLRESVTYECKIFLTTTSAKLRWM